MGVTLDEPLDWENAAGDDAAMLDDLQANIIRPHVRESLHALFLRFDSPEAGRAFLTAIRPLVKSARTHLEEVRTFAATGQGGTTYVGVGLSAEGYRAVEAAAAPADTSFDRGMRDAASRSTLLDPPTSVWEAHYREPIHAVVLIGDATDGAVTGTYGLVLDAIEDGVTVLGEETGLGQRNDDGNGIEHFGYVDGRSQPLFLTQDIEAERDTTDGIDAWDPSAPLSQVIVPDPGVDPDPATATAYGSYFVFRKLEQNVRRFKEAEAALAAALGLTGEDAERAGAMLVGRFEDGTPLTAQRADGAQQPVPNNFTYDSDPFGAKCPFGSHIRTTNPRGSSRPVDDAAGRAAEKSHLMARRGQTYGVRLDDVNDPDVAPEQRPTGGVGLLFMAFNTKIHFSFPGDFVGSQFNFTQAVWANNTTFPPTRDRGGNVNPFDAGVDPVMGQGGRIDQAFPQEWGETPLQTGLTAAAQAVTMKGGEYFFMPSLTYLANPV